VSLGEREGEKRRDLSKINGNALRVSSVEERKDRDRRKRIEKAGERPAPSKEVQGGLGEEEKYSPGETEGARGKCSKRRGSSFISSLSNI